MERNYAPTATIPAATSSQTGVVLQPGDVLIKYSDGSFGNALIKWGQMMLSDAGSSSSEYVHAAIAIAETTIIEAQLGSGLELHSIKLEEKYKPIRYRVIRCKQPKLAAEAVKIAMKAYWDHLETNKHPYDTAGAISACGTSKQPLRKAKLTASLAAVLFVNKEPAPFFCSSFIVAVYLAAEDKLKTSNLGNLVLDARYYEPGFLAEKLVGSNHFIDVGIRDGLISATGADPGIRTS